MTEQAASEEPRLAWRVHPAAERPLTGIAVLTAILLLGFMAGLWMGAPYWGAFAFVVLFLSLEAFFLPGSYELSAQRVVIKKPFSRAERPWEHFRRVIFDPVGVTLSPFARRNWLENYRALRLRYPSRKAVRGSGQPAGTGCGAPSPREIQAFILECIDPEKVTVEGRADGEAGREGQR
jgi:hypothetical protein